jgi:hypothetical protein
LGDAGQPRTQKMIRRYSNLYKKTAMRLDEPWVFGNVPWLVKKKKSLLNKVLAASIEVTS